MHCFHARSLRSIWIWQSYRGLFVGFYSTMERWIFSKTVYFTRSSEHSKRKCIRVSAATKHNGQSLPGLKSLKAFAHHKRGENLCEPAYIFLIQQNSHKIFHHWAKVSYIRIEMKRQGVAPHFHAYTSKKYDASFNFILALEKGFSSTRTLVSLQNI